MSDDQSAPITPEDKPLVGQPVIISPVVISKWYGFWVQHPAMFEQFWGLTCPCGITATYAINNFPTVTTKHPCTNPNHWTIQVEPVPPAPVAVDQPAP